MHDGIEAHENGVVVDHDPALHEVDDVFDLAVTKRGRGREGDATEVQARRVSPLREQPPRVVGPVGSRTCRALHHEVRVALQREQGKIIPWVFLGDGEPLQEFRRTWKRACT